MKTILTSVIIAAGIFASAPADAHPHHRKPVVAVQHSSMYVWVWVPSGHVFGPRLGDWYRVRRGSYLHRVYGDYHHPRRHYRRR